LTEQELGVELALAAETPLDPECHEPEVDGLDEEQLIRAWHYDEDKDEDEDDWYDCEEEGECAAYNEILYDGAFYGITVGNAVANLISVQVSSFTVIKRGNQDLCLKFSFTLFS
jgi:hypothetical protein